MANMTNEHRASLVRDLINLGAGAADSEDEVLLGKNFIPIHEHVQALDPDVVLVVGDRGAGKTSLCKALTQPVILRGIARQIPNLRLPIAEQEQVHFLQAFPLLGEGPDALGWQRFANDPRRGVTDVVSLWFAYLVRALRRDLDEEALSALAHLLDCPGGDAEACRDAFEKAGSAPLLALDRLDRRLKQRDQWRFVAYDELDTIVVADFVAMRVLLQGLITFWAGYSRRWQRLRAKIFLRTDFYRRNTELVGADITKISAKRAELQWSDKNLYAVLIKRIINCSQGLCEYGKEKVTTQHDADLGEIPLIARIQDAKPLIERMCGQYMGANESKGSTFKWILDHNRDGNSKVTPRTLVWLLEKAAALENERPRVQSGNQLLHHSSLRRAIEIVSIDHVRSAQTHEMPWLYGLKVRLTEMLVPFDDRREVEQRLRRNWKGSWGEGQEARPPADDASALVDYLIEIGVFRNRIIKGKERLDVPDLFQTGLGLKRHGGVARGE